MNELGNEQFNDEFIQRLRSKYSARESSEKNPFSNEFIDKTRKSILSKQYGPKKESFLHNLGSGLAKQIEYESINDSPEHAKQLLREAATIGAIEFAFAPLGALAATARYLPKTLQAANSLARSGAIGAALATGESLQQGKLPESKEVAKEAAQWVAVDAALQGLLLGARGIKSVYGLGKKIYTNAANNSKTGAIHRKISKLDSVIASATNENEKKAAIYAKKRLEASLPSTPQEVLGKMWDSAKTVLRDSFKWTKEKIRGFETGKVNKLKPEEARAILDQTKKIEAEVPEVTKPSVVKKPKEITTVTKPSMASPESIKIVISDLENHLSTLSYEEIVNLEKQKKIAQDIATEKRGKGLPTFEYSQAVQERNTVADYMSRMRHGELTKEELDLRKSSEKTHILAEEGMPPKEPIIKSDVIDEKTIEKISKLKEKIVKALERIPLLKNAMKKKGLSFAYKIDYERQIENLRQSIDSWNMKIQKLKKEAKQKTKIITKLEEPTKPKPVSENKEKSPVSPESPPQPKDIISELTEKRTHTVQSQKGEIELPKTLYHVTQEPIEGNLKKGHKGLIFYTTSLENETIKYGLQRENARLIKEIPNISKVYITKGLTADEVSEKVIEKLMADGYDAIYDQDKGHIAYFGKDREQLSKQELDKIHKTGIIYSIKKTNLIDDSTKKELLNEISEGNITSASQVNDYVRNKKSTEPKPVAENKEKNQVSSNVEPKIYVKNSENPISTGESESGKKVNAVVSPQSSSEKTALTRKGQRTPPSETANRRPVIGKEQAEKLSHIVKLFRKAFTDPIRMGKFRQRALGIHKMWPKVTRILKANDIETVAHEIGHNLHTTLYGGDAKIPAEQQANIIKALRPYLGELKQLAHYEPYTMEGFAEFTRMYVTNPDIARKLAPKFYDKFEADLDAQYPEMKNALLQAREYYEKYLQGTPQSRIESQYPKESALTKLKEWLEKSLDSDTFQTNWIDDVYPAKRLVSEAFGIPISQVESLKDPGNLYIALRVLKGSVGKAEVALLFETFDALTLDKNGEGLRQILEEIPTDKEMMEFNVYLDAARTIELSGRGLATGTNIGDAFYVKKELGPKYQDLAKRLYSYQDRILQYVRDLGVISKDMYKKIVKLNMMYVPFQRVMDYEKTKRVGAGGSLNVSKTVYKIGQSQRDKLPPLLGIIKNTYAMIIAAEKNHSAQILAELSKMKNMGQYVEKVPIPTTLKSKIYKEELEREVIKHLKKNGAGGLLLEDADGKLVLPDEFSAILPDMFLKFGPARYPAGENIVTVYRDGNPEYYEVSPDIFQMWNKSITPYETNQIVRWMSKPAKLLRYGAITNPKFIQKNFFEDMWGALVFSKYNSPSDFMDMLYKPFAMMAEAFKHGDLYVEFLKSGAGMATQSSVYRDDLKKKLAEIHKGIRPYQINKILRKLVEVSEESNRLTTFGIALEHEGKTRLGRQTAAFAARDISIDFAKMGLLVKSINQIIPFFNARIQGMDKLWRSGTDKDWKKFYSKIFTTIAYPALIFAWLNRDDKRYEEFSEVEKDANLITFIGDTAISFPLPHAMGAFVNGIMRRMFDFFWKKDPDAMKSFMGSIWQAAMPSFTPIAQFPIFEIWANKSFFTGTRIIPYGKENLAARFQYKDYTSNTARLLGRAMEYMPGSGEYSKAASPAVIEHFIVSFTGGLGRSLLKISDAGLKLSGLEDKIQGPEESVVEQFGLSAFTRRYPRSQTNSIEKFYDYFNEASSRKKTISYTTKNNLESETEIDIRIKDLSNLYDYNNLLYAKKAMDNSQKAINSIFKNPEIEPDIKRKMIDQLYLQRIEFARRAVESVKVHRAAKKVDQS